MDTLQTPQQVRARPGDLTFAWRVMLGISWLAAFLAYAAVYQASVQIGIGTWWIGPRAQPSNALIRILPFALSLSMAVLVIYNTPRIVRTSFVAGALAAAIAVPDFSRSTGLAVAEMLIAASLLVVSASALSGRLRVSSEVTVSAADVDGDVWAPPTNTELAAPAPPPAT